MTPRTHLALVVSLLALASAAPAMAQITLYANDAYQGASTRTQASVPDLTRRGFNDRASSAVVGQQMWEICDDAGYRGRCRVLRPGQYPSLAAMGMNDRVSSARPVGRKARVEDERYAPEPETTGDFRRRGREPLYEARVTSSRAVYGPREQRCWMESEKVPSTSGGANVPGAVLGAVLGGILGHQVGGGTGRDIATAGGVVTGAVIGSKTGNRNAPDTRQVQRCADTPAAARPVYWDVAYDFRGTTHRVQMTSAPGATVSVNRQGEPRA